MKYIITALLSCSALFSVSTAQAAVLTFDDVPGGSIQNNYGDMPTYQGFDFSGTPVSGTLDWIDVEGSGWPFGAHSGDFALLNNFSGTGIINQSGNADFTFGGLWAKQWNTAPESGGVASLLGTIRGFNNGLEVWSIDTALNGSYQFISGQAQVIDELHLGLGNHFLVDDIYLNQSPAAVPEPETYAMLLAGLGLVGFAARRRKTA